MQRSFEFGGLCLLPRQPVPLGLRYLVSARFHFKENFLAGKSTDRSSNFSFARTNAVLFFNP